MSPFHPPIFEPSCFPLGDSLVPPFDHGVRAERAIRERRWDEAWICVQRLSGVPTLEGAWRNLLAGLIRLGQGAAVQAADEFRRGITAVICDALTEVSNLALLGLTRTGTLNRNPCPVAPEWSGHDQRPGPNGTATPIDPTAAPSDPPIQLSDHWHLMAVCLHWLGVSLRRQDRWEDSTIAFRSAHELRVRVGTRYERWVTAVELGRSFDVAAKFCDADHWYAAALEGAGNETVNGVPLQAMTWSVRAVSEWGREHLTEAESAARRARDAWRVYDAGCAGAALADLLLGRVLLARWEQSSRNGSGHDSTLLDESVRHLSAARETLEPYGPLHEPEVQEVRALLDLAERVGAPR